MKREELFNAITAYVRAAIDYETASNQEGADGYMATASYERKQLEMATEVLKDTLDKLDPAKVRHMSRISPYDLAAVGRRLKRRS